MLNSFPVYRRGMLLAATEEVSTQTADVVARLVSQHAEVYLQAFIAASRAAGAGHHQPQPGQDVHRHGSKRVFDFRGVSLRHGRFTIDSRSSLTACIGTRRSKLWVRLSCTELGGKPACNLTVLEIKDFFALAESLSQQASEALLGAYRRHLAAAGIELDETEPYSFSFRAFNSRDRAVERMLDQLGADLALKKALRESEYAAPLRDYFELAIDGSLNSEQIIARLKGHAHEIFTYRSPSHQALYTATIGPRHTDLCGFGYDRRRKPSRSSLASATTAGLLEEYAH